MIGGCKQPTTRDKVLRNPYSAKVLPGEIIMPNLNIAEEEFDAWMKDCVESHKRSGIYSDHNKALLEFLNSAGGFRYIKTYEEFCELSKLLQEKGYQTKNPPCQPVDFAQEIEQAGPKSFGNSRPVMPEGVSNELAAMKFNAWMKDYVESHKRSGTYSDHNKALLEFLNIAKGFRYIKTYEEFCELSKLLQEKGYQTKNPPCQPVDFAQEIEQADPKSFGNSRPVMPEGMSNELAAKSRIQKLNEVKTLKYLCMKSIWTNHKNLSEAPPEGLEAEYKAFQGTSRLNSN